MAGHTLGPVGRTPRIGIVGAGGIAPAHIDGWQALGAEVAILRRTGADDLAARYGLHIHDTLDDLLHGVQIVDIVSPTATHLAIARAAAAAGRHIVCEKPLAVTASDARELTRVAATAGVRLFPAHVVRYFPGYRYVHEQIDTVGTLTHLTLRRTVAAPDALWFFAQDAGGGLIRDLMIHDLDQVLWLAGPVARVSATQDPPAVGGVVRPPVSAHVRLTHVGGAVSDVHAAWAAPGTPFRSTLHVTGDRGTLAAGTDDPPTDDEAAASDPYTAQLADFLDAIRTGRVARVTPVDGIAAVALVDAAYTALATGRPITVAGLPRTPSTAS